MENGCPLNCSDCTYFFANAETPARPSTTCEKFELRDAQIPEGYELSTRATCIIDSIGAAWKPSNHIEMHWRDAVVCAIAALDRELSSCTEKRAEQAMGDRP